MVLQEVLKRKIITMEYYSAIEKNKIMAFAETWMDLESIILSEVSQREEPGSLQSIGSLRVGHN